MKLIIALLLIASCGFAEEPPFEHRYRLLVDPWDQTRGAYVDFGPIFNWKRESDLVSANQPIVGESLSSSKLENFQERATKVAQDATKWEEFIISGIVKEKMRNGIILQKEAGKKKMLKLLNYPKAASLKEGDKLTVIAAYVAGYQYQTNLLIRTYDYGTPLKEVPSETVLPTEVLPQEVREAKGYTKPGTNPFTQKLASQQPLPRIISVEQLDLHPE
jgi:hypothetical protein